MNDSSTTGSQPGAPQSATPSAADPRQPPGTAGPAAFWFLLADVVLVVVFAAVGRSSHGEGLGGTLSTAWPFLVGALLGWLLVRAWRSPGALWPVGVVVWLATVAGGMLVRALTGQGTHWSFVVVSLVANAVFLLGYRLVVGTVRSRRDRDPRQ